MSTSIKKKYYYNYRCRKCKEYICTDKTNRGQPFDVILAGEKFHKNCALREKDEQIYCDLISRSETILPNVVDVITKNKEDHEDKVKTKRVPVEILESLNRSIECTLESDPRTFQNRECEYGFLFDRMHEWKKLISNYID